MPRLRQTRIWSPKDNNWIVAGEFPTLLAGATGTAEPRDRGVRFGILHDDGLPTAIVRNEEITGAWHFDGATLGSRSEIARRVGNRRSAVCHLPPRAATRACGCAISTATVACELVVSNPSKQGGLRFDARPWLVEAADYALPDGLTIVDAQGRDAGLRFVDVDWEGTLDLIARTRPAIRPTCSPGSTRVGRTC